MFRGKLNHNVKTICISTFHPSKETLFAMILTSLIPKLYELQTTKIIQHDKIHNHLNFPCISIFSMHH